MIELLSDAFTNDGRVFKLVSKTELNTRCMFCGDSTKNKSSMHMYIGLKNDVALYYCQRCNVRGVVNINFVREYQLDSYAKEIYNRQPRYATRRVGHTSKIIPMVYGKVPRKFTRSMRDKYDYFVRRTGIKRFDLEKYGVILDLDKFLDDNADIIKALKYEIKPYFQQILNEDYIMFLSRSNNSIVCRYVGEDKEARRFFTLNLRNDIKFYLVKDKVDPSKPITIHMAEGIFDIINLHTMLYKPNHIFVACLNKDYKTKIQWFMKRFINIEQWVFYIDKDVKWLNQFDPVSNKAICINGAEGVKDFGDINDKLIVRKLLRSEIERRVYRNDFRGQSHKDTNNSKHTKSSN